MKIKKPLFLLNNDLEKNISEITFSLNDELFNSFLNSITTKHQYLLNNEITNLTNNLSKLSELSELKYNDNTISLKVFNILINLYKKLFYFNKNINYKLSVNILNQMLNIIYMHNNNNYKNIDKNNTFSFNSIYFDYNTINFFDELLKKHYIYNDDYLNYSTLNETERHFFVNNIFLRYIKIRNVINENKTNVFLYELFLNSFKKFEFDNFENYNFSISKFNNKLIKKYNFPPLYRSKNFCGFIPITFNTSNNENKIQINNEKDEINISEYLSKNKNKSVKVISNNTIYSFNNEKNELLKNKILKYEEYLYTNLDLNFEKYNSNQCQLLKDIMVTYKNYDFNYELDFEFEYKNFEQYYNLSLYDIHVIYKLECELFLHYHKKIFPKHFLSHLPLSYNNIYIDYLINSKIKNTNIYIDLFKKTISYNSAKGLYDYEFFNKLLADYLFKIKFDSLTNQDEKNNIINQISKINKNEHFNYLDLYKPEFYHSKIHENELELDFIKEILKCSHYLKPHESKTNEHNIKILEKI